MKDFNTGIPSTRWLQAMVQNKTTVNVQLTTGDRIAGRVKWLDPDCICLVASSGGEQLVWRQAIATISSNYSQV